MAHGQEIKMFVVEISRLPAGDTEPNSLCHVAWPGKNLKKIVACKNFFLYKKNVCMYVCKKKISRSPAGVTKPNSLCHVAWPGKLLYVKKISRSPAGVTKPNSLCHVAWPGKNQKKISRSPARVTKPNSLCHVAWPGKCKKISRSPAGVTMPNSPRNKICLCQSFLPMQHDAGCWACGHKENRQQQA
jgi:hypothetical protein